MYSLNFYYLFGNILHSFTLVMNAFDNRYLAEKLEIKLQILL